MKKKGRPSRSDRHLVSVPKARTLAHPSPATLLVGAISFLELAAVTEHTLVGYSGHVDRFLLWCRWTGCDWSSIETLDATLVAFFVNLALDGFEVATGRTTMAGVKHFVPALAGTRRGLPRAARALDGWSRLVPPQMRLPLPRVGMLAIVGYLIAMGQAPMAVFVRLAFDAYLRPNECYRLTPNSLVPPAGALSLFRGWGLIVNNAESGRVGKTGVSDESVTIDNEDLWTVLEALLLGRRGCATLWEFTELELRRWFSRAVSQLGLPPSTCLYALRHGGASDDLLSGRRTLKETKERGRWVTDSSLRRYAKRTRMQQLTAAMPPDVMDFGAAVEHHIPELILMVAQRKPFPLVVPHHVAATASPALRPPPSLTRRWAFT